MVRTYKLIILLLLACSLQAQNNEGLLISYAGSLTWLSLSDVREDYKAHYTCGYVISVITYDITKKPLIACAVGCLAGLVKDIVIDNWIRKGNTNWTDIKYTAYGSTIASLSIKITLAWKKHY